MHIDRLDEDEWERLRVVRLAALLDAPEAFGTRHEDAAALAEASWREQLRRLATFIAVQEERDVGMVRGIPHADLDDTTYLISMWVDPKARRQGVGSALIDAIVGWTLGMGRRRVLLDVRTDNAAAQQLYRAKGFAPTGEQVQVGAFTELQFSKTL